MALYDTKASQARLDPPKDLKDKKTAEVVKSEPTKKK